MAKKEKHSFIITCEHGGNQVPKEYQTLFNGHEMALYSHRGMDFGALELVQALKKKYKAPTITSTITRLFVELNRSLNHPNLFSEFIEHLSDIEKQTILRKYYFPYRKKVEETILKLIKEKKKVIHLSIHSFTPILNGMVRNCDIGLLYDPQHEGERIFCQKWKDELKNKSSKIKVRYNYPYKGVSDGFTTHLRKKISATQYIGIELEVNQQLLTSERKKEIIQVIVDSLSNLY